MPLNAKQPVGNGVEGVQFASEPTNIIPTSAAGDVSLSNDLGINPGASSENRSAKFRRPNPQDVPAAGQNQYQ